MSGFNILFHATREEVVEFSYAVSKRQGVYVFARKFNPFQTILLESNFDFLKDEDSPYSSLMLTNIEPKWPVLEQFPVEYPDRIIIFLPKIHNNELCQQSFGLKIYSSSDYNKDALSKWKNIASELKKLTKPGVRMYYQDTGILTEADMKFRYTAGAKRAFDNGVTLTFPNPGPIGILE